MALVKRYRIAENGQKIVEESTPNPVWDEHGHLFLMIEEHGEMQFSELLSCIREYNRRENATMPTEPSEVKEGLGSLINAGILEAVEVDLR